MCGMALDFPWSFQLHGPAAEPATRGQVRQRVEWMAHAEADAVATWADPSGLWVFAIENDQFPQKLIFPIKE